MKKKKNQKRSENKKKKKNERKKRKEIIRYELLIAKRVSAAQHFSRLKLDFSLSTIKLDLIITVYHNRRFHNLSLTFRNCINTSLYWDLLWK